MCFFFVFLFPSPQLCFKLAIKFHEYTETKRRAEKEDYKENKNYISEKDRALLHNLLKENPPSPVVL